MEVKVFIKRFVGIATALTGLLVVLLAGGFALLNSQWLQQKMLGKAAGLLTEKLQTRVGIDSVSIDLLTLDAKLYGLTVEDRQQRPMFGLQFVQADVDIHALLWSHEIRITEARLEGVKAELHKAPKGTQSPDTVANYQFLLDAFKTDKKPQQTDTTAADSKQKKLTFSMSTLTAERIDVTYNEDRFHLGLLQFSQLPQGSYNGRIEHLETSWERVNKKGIQVSHRAEIGLLEYAERDGERLADLKGVHFATDNHRPRKNKGRPKHGAFDVGHLNLWGDMKLRVDSIATGRAHGYISDCTVSDTLTGIDIRQLHSEVAVEGNTLTLKDMHLQQGTTVLSFKEGRLRLPNKREGTTLHYSASAIKGTVVLKDIARPFAPVLGGFTLPLQLSTRMDGDDEGIRFHDVVVKRPNNLLTVKASGRITNLKDKYKLKVHFDIQKATFKEGEKERVINQFQVKKYMMKQLHALGTVHYSGAFNVLWKKEEFQGTLHTEPGNVSFYFALDEMGKYLHGKASTEGLDIGRIMDMPDIGAVAASARFKFDISKPRTAMMRWKLGGKLPIGEMTAHVDEASYKFIKARNLDVQIASNGAIAEGSLCAPRKLADMNFDFSFTKTNEMKKMKVKPRLKLNILRKSNKEH